MLTSLPAVTTIIIREYKPEVPKCLLGNNERACILLVYITNGKCDLNTSLKRWGNSLKYLTFFLLLLF